MPPWQKAPMVVRMHAAVALFYHLDCCEIVPSFRSLAVPVQGWQGLAGKISMIAARDDSICQPVARHMYCMSAVHHHANHTAAHLLHHHQVSPVCSGSLSMLCRGWRARQ